MTSDALREALRLLGLTYRQLEVASGVGHTVVFRFLRGHSIGSASHDRLSALVERRLAMVPA